MKKPRPDCSRRESCGGAQPPRQPSALAASPRPQPSGPPSPAAFRPTLLNQVQYAQVDLDPGPGGQPNLAQQQFEQCREVLLNLSDDGLLRPFRFREGLPAPGDELGGWYSTEGFAAACPFGQWISALSRMYAVTRDPATYAKIDRMIRGYAATLEPIGKFYQNYRFPRLHLRQAVHRPYGRACFRASPHGSRRPRALDRYRPALLAAQSHAASGNAHPRRRGLHPPRVGRNLHHAGKSIPRLAAHRQPALLAIWPSVSSSTSIFDPLSRGENALARPPCLQSCECVGLRGNGVSRARRRKISPRRNQRLRLCPAAELRHRRMGSARALHRARQRRTRRKPEHGPRQL